MAMNCAAAVGETPVLQASLRITQTREGIQFAGEKEKMAWYHYLSKVFMKAGHYRALNILYQFMNNLQVPQGPLVNEKSRVMGKIGKKLQKVTKMVQGDIMMTDKVALDSTMLLISQGYTPARQTFKQNTGPFVSDSISDDYKVTLLSLAVIDFDSLNNRPKVPLWEDYWKLSLDQKIAVMDFAQLFSRNTSAAPAADVPKIGAVRARVLVIKGGKKIDELLKAEELENDQVEPHMLRAYRRWMKKDYCGAIKHFEEGVKVAAPDAATSINARIKRFQKKCLKSQVSGTFNAFCQVNDTSTFPISAEVKDPKVTEEIFHRERLFWTSIWVGDCKAAKRNFEQISQIVKSHEGLKSNQSISNRVKHMNDDILKGCQDRSIFDSNAGDQVYKLLEGKKYEEALALAKNSGDRELEHACRLFKYPKASYSPCLGSTVLSGDRDEDTILLSLVERLEKGEAVEDCPTNNAKCLFTQVQAFFILGNYPAALAKAKMINPSESYCKPVVMMLGCMELCNSPQFPALLTSAKKHFGGLVDTTQDQPNLTIAKGLSESISRDPEILKPTEQDPVDGVLGKIPKPKKEKKNTMKPKAKKSKIKAPPTIPLPRSKPKKLKLGSCAPKPKPQPSCGCSSCCACQQQSPCSCQLDPKTGKPVNMQEKKKQEEEERKKKIKEKTEKDTQRMFEEKCDEIQRKTQAFARQLMEQFDCKKCKEKAALKVKQKVQETLSKAFQSEGSNSSKGSESKQAQPPSQAPAQAQPAPKPVTT